MKNNGAQTGDDPDDQEIERPFTGMREEISPGSDGWKRFRKEAPKFATSKRSRHTGNGL
jgi:hypothetical protein